MGEIVELHKHQAADQRSRLAARLREFQAELVQVLIDLLLGEGAFDRDVGRDELRAAILETATGRTVVEVAIHLEAAAFELAGPSQDK